MMILHAFGLLNMTFIVMDLFEGIYIYMPVHALFVFYAAWKNERYQEEREFMQDIADGKDPE